MADLKKKMNNGEKAGNAYEVLLEPVITEAATVAMELNKYSFKVAKSATKIEIKNAIEDLYKVKVLGVNTANYKRKFVNYGRTPGFRAGSKKAIVTLKEGDSIDLFKGA